MALFDIRKNLLDLADQAHPSTLILLDLSAAFDTIDQAVLLQKLVTVAGLDWCQSFLSGRPQQVRIGDVRSSPRVVTCGDPQGSALSPLLFNIYMRPPVDILEESGLGFHMYADDTQLMVDLVPGAVGRANLGPCLERIRGWMSRNWLLLNEGKT